MAIGIKANKFSILYIVNKRHDITGNTTPVLGEENFPLKIHLEYGSTFTKLFMHVSSRNMFPTTT
jgi:hypothetical protein